MKKLLIAVAFLFVANFAVAQDAAKTADVKKLLQLSGANAQMEVAKKQVLAMIPKEKQEAFMKEFDASLKPISESQETFYLTEFTTDEIKQIIKFYESPVGKKVAEKSVKQAEGNMTKMQEWSVEMQGILMKYMQ